ncbi:glycosyltransferase family 4 protein [Bradyrhizobium jicamae]|uniref:Glycosyltransferase family 4 protein n=1 Tax=Bradyrhizobium jicamae TaxID=280332 RepID=A0ABS5FXY6_9BRAD|nr:glycosyltransferase family 4 protein [Bradyrhizobium jicamae]MBR0801689.1 glycosyltransferase family 4 protein [Bradyrhizobium jicamae]
MFPGKEQEYSNGLLKGGMTVRIGLFAELFAPSVGGQELFFEGLSRQLVKNGHAVDIHCIGHVAGLADIESVGGVTIFRHPTDEFYKAPRFRMMKRAWPTIIKYALHVRRVSKEMNYDVLVLNQWPLLHAMTIPRSQRAKAVLHWCEIRTGLFYNAIQAVLPRLVARNVAISDAVAQSIQRFSAGPVHTLPSGIEVEHFQSLPRDERSGICYLGRMAAHKNLPLLINAFELLKDGGYGGKLTLAGDGPVFDEIRDRARASRYGADIVLTGLISDREKIELLSRSESLVISSLREGFPRVVAEAMASGLPVVTCDFATNGTKDVVELYGCGVVTRAEPEYLARGMRDVIARWDHYSGTGRAAAKSLSWALIAKNFEELVVSGLDDRRPSLASRLSEASAA